MAVSNEGTGVAYTLGRGLHLLDGKLILGGYSNIQYSHLDGARSRLDLRSLSLIANWQASPRWQVFSELELVDGLSLDSSGFNTHDAKLDVERLYIEYAAAQRLNVRFGKFLTPIGRWNQIHAAPLVWTVSRPLVSAIPFSRHTTGLSVNGSFPSENGSLDYIAYTDNSEVLDPDEDESDIEGTGDIEEALLRLPAFENAIGAYISYKQWSTNLELGLSLANFHLQGAEERNNLIGIDAFWQAVSIELSSEAIYRFSNEQDKGPEWGGFLQIAVPVWQRLYGIVRHERFHSADLGHASHNTSLGLTYRQRPAIVYKLEFREGSENSKLASDGILASFAILF